MEQETITLSVNPEIARIYRDASPEDRALMETLFGLDVRRVEEDKRRPLEPRRQALLDALHELRAEAMANGLTEEAVEEILADE